MWRACSAQLKATSYLGRGGPLRREASLQRIIHLRPPQAQQRHSGDRPASLIGGWLGIVRKIWRLVAPLRGADPVSFAVMMTVPTSAIIIDAGTGPLSF